MDHYAFLDVNASLIFVTMPQASLTLVLCLAYSLDTVTLTKAIGVFTLPLDEFILLAMLSLTKLHFLLRTQAPYILFLMIVVKSHLFLSGF